MSNVPILLFLLSAFFVIALRLYEIVALGDQHSLRCSNYKPSFDLGFCEPRRGLRKTSEPNLLVQQLTARFDMNTSRLSTTTAL
jgi:hypothetical protein